MISRNPVDREARILILGAGPGGLSAAHFLSKHGFKNVTVFEKLGRIGGMCRSVTEDNQSFDLGAVFVSSAYREVLRMARCVGAELERFEGATAFVYDETSQSARYHGLLLYVMGGSSLSAFCRFTGLCLRYLWKRYRIRKIFRRPGWVGIDAHPALCVTFNELMAFYARLASSEPTAADELRLRENIERYIGALGGRINEQDDWSSYDAWLYFKHVGVEEFRQRYFDRWEEVQGKNRTFFVGGLFDFDYVEGIVRYSRYLVEQHFAGKTGS